MSVPMCRLEYIITGGYPFHVAMIEDAFFAEFSIVLAANIPESTALEFIDYYLENYDWNSVNPGADEIMAVFRQWLINYCTEET